MAGAPPWTPAEDARLMALLEEGGGYEHAGQALGRGTEACRSRVKTLRQKARPAPAGETRRCLSCDGPFPKVAGLFVCGPCKKTAAWQSGPVFA
jgi:hypothetical protein